MNIVYIPFKEYWDKAMSIFNPRDAMMISHNDGLFNNQTNVFKDTLINVNAFVGLGKKGYTQAQLDKFAYIKRKYQK